MKILIVWGELFHADGQRNQNGEDDSGLSQSCHRRRTDLYVAVAIKEADKVNATGCDTIRILY